MERSFERFKGIHPGLILERELKRQAIKPSPFTLSIEDTHRQVFNAIIKGKRGIPVPLYLKVDKALGVEEGTFALLQTYHDIEKVKGNTFENQIPNLSSLRKALFWDTDIENIDWENQYKAVIKRVFERGNQSEKDEITRFYGPEKIKRVLADYKIEPMILHKRLK
ncbi:plasmid maintenance system antidote protein [Sphingobacterium olei]|uniref:Plasmid maintenance system antidote protein n=1 Tax=Sphingobacterium olei TaxID=2571155 RepID=A0A4U0P675_9SPHI|nr:plasmid maintenance system antidote protein [Sphingobacterium olei]TJZ62925.1 plasmid maintenance system antidote protein [Sphingobacterium olei]